MDTFKLIVFLNSLCFFTEKAKAPPSDPIIMTGGVATWRDALGNVANGPIVMVRRGPPTSPSPYEGEDDGTAAADAAVGAPPPSRPKIFQGHVSPPAGQDLVPGARSGAGQVMRLSSDEAEAEVKIIAAFGQVMGPNRTLPHRVPITTPKKAKSFTKVFDANKKILQDYGIVKSDDNSSATASKIQQNLQSAARSDKISISPVVQKAMMVVMAHLEYQNSSTKEPDAAISQAFHALNAAVGGNEFRTISPTIAQELSPAEAYYIGRVYDGTWSANITRKMVPDNVDQEDIAKYADQYKKNAKLPTDVTIPKNWSDFSSLIQKKLTFESNPQTMTIDRITFDGQSIVRGDGGWTGAPDSDGGDRFIRKLAAAMYATGNVHPPTMESVIQKMAANPDADLDTVQKAHATQTLLRLAAGLADPETGQRPDRVAGSTFDGTFAPEGSIIHGGATPATFASRQAFFLATAIGLDGMTNAQIVGYLQTVSPDLQQAADRVTEQLPDDHKKEAKTRILRNAVKNIQPSSDAYKFGNTWVLAQDLWDGRMDVRDFLLTLKSGIDLNEDQQKISESMKLFPQLRLDNQVRAAMIYNSFKENKVDLAYAISLVINADTTHSSQAQKSLVKAVADQLGEDVESGLMGEITVARRDANSDSNRETARWKRSYSIADQQVLNIAYAETNKAAEGTWEPGNIPPERQYWGANKPVNELDAYTYFQLTGKPLPSDTRAGIWPTFVDWTFQIDVYERAGGLVSQSFCHQDPTRAFVEPASLLSMEAARQAQSLAAQREEDFWLQRATTDARVTVTNDDGSASTSSLSSLSDSRELETPGAGGGSFEGDDGRDPIEGEGFDGGPEGI